MEVQMGINFLQIHRDIWNNKFVNYIPPLWDTIPNNLLICISTIFQIIQLHYNTKRIWIKCCYTQNQKLSKLRKLFRIVLIIPLCISHCGIIFNIVSPNAEDYSALYLIPQKIIYFANCVPQCGIKVGFVIIKIIPKIITRVGIKPRIIFHKESHKAFFPRFFRCIQSRLIMFILDHFEHIYLFHLCSFVIYGTKYLNCVKNLNMCEKLAFLLFTLQKKLKINILHYFYSWRVNF